MTNKQFVEQVASILGDDFFLSDMIWQEELFEKQDKLANLIAKASNKGNALARYMVTKLPETFVVG